MKNLPLWLRRFPVRVVVLIQCVYFQARSLTRRSFIFDEDGLPVSIATYGHREKWLHLTIESIMRGKTRPSAIFIWRDSNAENAPKALRRLKKCGVTMHKLDSRHRSHKKWFGPASFEVNLFDKGFVLADDDLIFPKNWMTELRRVAEENPKNVVAWRCKSIRLEPTQKSMAIAPYKTWQRGRKGSSANHMNFATSGSGTYVPPNLLRALRDSSPNMEHIRFAPTADDVWLNLIALRARVAKIGVSEKYLDWPQSPMQGVSGLADENVGEGKNDEIVSECYTDEDVSFLIGAEAELQ